LDIESNPSWEIASKLPSSLDGANGEMISVIVPAEPTPAAYHKIADQAHSLIEQHRPDMVLHLGLNADNAPGMFKVERSASKEGYHSIPDAERKVISEAENKQLFGKLPDSLVTTMDLKAAADVCQDACGWLGLPKIAAPAMPKGKNTCNIAERPRVDIRMSDDMDTYVSGFQYYMSMLGMEKMTGRRDVAFLQLPKLDSDAEIRVGVRVVEEMIEALVGVLKA
jgi:pyroglutamyl-peptidase